MKKSILLIIIFLFISGLSFLVYFQILHNSGSNKTETGYFWYTTPTDIINNDIKYSYYHNVFKYGNIWVIHVIAMRSEDNVIYEKGQSRMDNDTLKLHIQECEKIHFGMEIKRSFSLRPINMYFTTSVKPTNITITFDEFKPIPLDSIEIVFK